MKKIFGILLICFMILCSCSQKPFDLEKAKKKVLNMGYSLEKECKTEEEIKQIEQAILTTMKFDKYDTEGIQLGVTYYVRYVMSSIVGGTYDIYELVYFIIFDTPEHAKFTYDYFVKSRNKESEWRNRLIDNIVISSNNQQVRKAIGGSFE